MIRIVTRLSPARIGQDSRLKRRVAIGALYLLLAAVTALAARWVDAVMSSTSHTFSDRLAEASIIIAGGTLVLALIAAIVAVMAYAVATGLPDLKVRVDDTLSKSNRPILAVRLRRDSSDFYITKRDTYNYLSPQ